MDGNSPIQFAPKDLLNPRLLDIGCELSFWFIFLSNGEATVTEPPPPVN